MLNSQRFDDARLQLCELFDSKLEPTLNRVDFDPYVLSTLSIRVSLFVVSHVQIVQHLVRERLLDLGLGSMARAFGTPSVRADTFAVILVVIHKIKSST